MSTSKILHFVFAILLLTSCNEQPILVETKNNSDSLPPTYSKLHNLFQDIAADSFYVFSDWTMDNKNFLFKGQAMDSLQVTLLPYDIKNKYIWNKDFAACYKFPLDTKNIALIARVSGEYSATAIKLFVFDLQKDSIVNTINLADNIGDAKEIFVFNSCIFKHKDNGILILTYSWSSFDHGVSNWTSETDTLVEYCNDYYLFHLTNNKLDTLSKDSVEIVTNYPNIVNKLAGH